MISETMDGREPLKLTLPHPIKFDAASPQLLPGIQRKDFFGLGGNIGLATLLLHSRFLEANIATAQPIL
jgi:hypothetical protein